MYPGSYADVDLGCNPTEPSGSLGTATATDVCGAVTITSQDGSVVSDGCNRSVTRTFTARDGCNNTSSTSRTVRWIADVTPPTFTGRYADVNLGWKKTAWLQSYTYSDFGDVKMGKNYPDDFPTFGRRDSFMTRINGIDSVVKNPDPQVQKFSGYKQWDMLQKLLFKQSEKVSHMLNVQYSNTTNVPRYDRLQDKRNGTLRYAEWYYGPQERLLTSYELSIGKTGWFDNININVNYQAIEERLM